MRLDGAAVTLSPGTVPVEATLPEHVEQLFDVLAEVLEASGDKARDHADPTFDYVRARTMKRVRWGQERFGERWRTLDKPEEAKQEGLDWFVYLMGECAERGHDPDLFDALHKMYLGLEAVLRYQARAKGTP